MGSQEKASLIMELRNKGIHRQEILRAVEAVPREDFVSPEFMDLAWQDMALPITCGQTISQPYVVAYMSEKLAAEPDDTVLEVGTGSGYQAAILSHLAHHVYSIDRHSELTAKAEKRFADLGIGNITCKSADGIEGWEEHAPFDKIIITAATAEVPEPLVEQLKPGGCMVLPQGDPEKTQHIVVLYKTARGLERKEFIPVSFVPLVSGS
jgi:protein-L-isoaspartate(D-aspartate) O-methyltransferase